MIDEYIDKLLDKLIESLEKISSAENDVCGFKENLPLIKLQQSYSDVLYVYNQLSVMRSLLRQMAYKSGIEPKRGKDDNSETKTD